MVTKGKHSQKRSILVLLAGAVGFTLITLYQYGVGRAADETANKLASRHALAVSSYSPPQPARALSVILPKDESELGDPSLKNSGASVLQWATRENGAAADAILLQEVVSGTVDRPLVLTGVSASHVNCQPPVKGTVILPSGAGPLPKRSALIDLDTRTHVARPQVAIGGHGWGFPLQVSQADAERFAFIVSTEKHNCTFELTFRYRDGESRRTYEVDNHGKPFHVSSSVAATSTKQWTIAGDSLQLTH